MYYVSRSCPQDLKNLGQSSLLQQFNSTQVGTSVAGFNVGFNLCMAISPRGAPRPALKTLGAALQLFHLQHRGNHIDNASTDASRQARVQARLAKPFPL